MRVISQRWLSVSLLWGGFVEVACVRRLADHFCQAGYAQLMLGQAVDRSFTQGVAELAPTHQCLESYLYWLPPCRDTRPLSLVHSPSHSVDTANTVVQVHDRSFT
jgi:hypothetical protein